MTVEEHTLLYNDPAEDDIENFAVEIKDAKYEETSAEDVAKEQKHLSPMQQQLLQKVLEKMPALFDGKLGLYPHKKIHLEVEEGSRSYHTKAYSVLHVHLEVFKKELLHLVSIGCVKAMWTDRMGSRDVHHP
eukprot:3026028-Ditylum_brightwellii.AAC.1